MSLAARIRERLPTWTGTDAELTRILGCHRGRVSSVRARSGLDFERDCARCHRSFKPGRGGSWHCPDCRGDRRTWSDRVARQPYLAAGSQRCGVCGELGHNARRHREIGAVAGPAKVEVDGANVGA